MYCHGNPVLYKDPSGHNAWSGTGFDPAKPYSNDVVDSTGAGYYSGAVITTGITGGSAAGSMGAATPAGVAVGVAAGTAFNYGVQKGVEAIFDYGYSYFGYTSY